MMYGQYCRIESRAGGVNATHRQFIRAALSCIKKPYRFRRASRNWRHQWLREGLEALSAASRSCREVTKC